VAIRQRWAIKVVKSRRWLRDPQGNRLEWDSPPKLGHVESTFDLAFILSAFGLQEKDVSIEVAK
jgi:hypothetical protein